MRRSAIGTLLLSLVCTAGCMSLGGRSRWWFVIKGPDPDGTLRKVATEAAGRWASAAGLDVRVVDSGSDSLSLQWVTRDQMSKQANAILPAQPGLSDVVAGALTVNPSPNVHHILVRDDLGDAMTLAAVTHEMAHAITDSGEHSRRGVFSPINHPGDVITSDDLETVCSRANCVFATPEPDPAEQTG